MAKSKVTLKDLASICGVSIATVSYVLNDVRNEHISHETRVRILETARKLNYIPCKSRAATHIRTNNIGIMLHLDATDSYSKTCICHDLAMELQKYLLLAGYHATISTLTEELGEKAYLTKSSIDAAFIIDTDSHAVHKLTQKYYVPLIFINCEINDQLFYRIYPNYSVILSQAKRILGEEPQYLVMDHIQNEELTNLICKNFHSENIFLNDSTNNLPAFLSKMRHKKGIILGDILGLSAERYLSNENFIVISYLKSDRLLLPGTQTITISNHTIASSAVNLLDRLFQSEYNICPDNLLLLNPDS